MFAQRGKTGDYEDEKKEDKQISKETLITSPAKIVEKKVTMQETVNALHRKISKRMQKHSGIKSKVNMGTSPLIAE